MNEKIAIIAGGELDSSFLLPFIQREQFEYVIAVDGALAFTFEHRIPIQAAVGDFDTIAEETLQKVTAQDGLYVERHVPEKDETDTELALHIAMKRNPKSITILGAAGGRLDHFLGNMQILLQPLRADIPCAIVDACNRIHLHKESFVIHRAEQFGKYVSLLPWTPNVENLSLIGFQYPLSHVIMEQGDSLGISNELCAETGTVQFDSGVLVCIESKDRRR